jgi:hypothetical protein
MTTTESRALQPGDRIIWNNPVGDSKFHGTVIRSDHGLMLRYDNNVIDIRPHSKSCDLSREETPDRQPEAEGQILTHQHPRFVNFCNRLGAVLWPPGQRGPSCGGDYGAAIDILNTIPGVDIPGTTEWFESEGAFCDCEIMFNIACKHTPAQ